MSHLAVFKSNRQKRWAWSWPLAALILLLFCQPLTANEDLFPGPGRAQADADYAAGRYEQARSGYETWLEHNPRDHEAWFRLGNLYTQLVQPMDALTAYRKAQLLKPEDGRAWHNMGMLYLRLALESYDNLRRNVPADDPLVPYAEQVLGGILDLVGQRLQPSEGPTLKPLPAE
ncbi:MAG: tetratricopeptide repeat protein [Gammaproteobacteria bacterium SHHR-1]